MGLKKRLAALERIEDYLLVLDEGQADDVLRAADPSVMTPLGWGSLPKQDRRAAIRRLLAEQPSHVIDKLLEATPTEETTKKLNAIAQALAAMDASRVDLVLSQAGANASTHYDWDDRGAGWRREIIRKLLLTQPTPVLDALAELAEESAAAEAGATTPQPTPPPTGPVPPSPDAVGSPAPGRTNAVVDETGPIFVVHGHASGIRHEAARMLEQATGRKVIVLHEMPNAGRTVLEKFEHHAAHASYAVVLLTGDDEGGTKTSSDRHPRGRQNVIFELGFFFGKLGRDRVAVLLEGDVEKPSDIAGLSYISIDPGGAWKQSLAQELESVGISVHYSKIPRS